MNKKSHSKMLFIRLGVLLLVSNHVSCAKILGIFPMPYMSHQVVYQKIWKELSLRGHQVTVITPNPLQLHNLTNLVEIDTGSTYEIWKKADLVKDMDKDISPIKMTFNLFSHVEKIMMEHFKVAEPLFKNRKQKFDLILTEIHPALDNFLGCIFEAPVFGISSLGLHHQTHDAVGNPTHPVISPDFMLHFIKEMNLYGRLNSFLQNFWYRLLYNWDYLPRMDKIAHKFSHECPFLSTTEKYLSFVLINTNPFLHGISPKVPNMVEMGQIHIKNKTEKLPKDLQYYLDSSKQGAIYFSLGTNVRSVDLPPRIRNIIIGALSELPYNVLWKWENDSLPNKPKNVMTMKWLPQQEVLKHKNIKAFITQAGLQSMEEAINHCVPMIGIPFFGDQPSNALKLVSLGIGRNVDYAQISKKELKEAILDVAGNEVYKQNIEKIRNVFFDHPMAALQKSIWWIEYVLRNKSAKYLRSPAADLSWFEYHFADVIILLLFVLTGFSCCLFSASKILRKMIKN